MHKIALREKTAHCNPQALGANCSACPLYQSGRHLAIPVPSENVKSAKLAILVDSPGKAEEERGYPLAGSFGYYLNHTFKELGIRREDTAILHTVLCKPGKLFRPEQWKAAVEACRPRLIRELRIIKPNIVFTIGNWALRVLTGKPTVLPWYGSTLGSPMGDFKVFPSAHALNIQNKPAMRPVFKRWLKTAKDLAYGVLSPFTWNKIVATSATTSAILPALEKLANEPGPIAIDIENNPSTGNIRAIGTASSKLAVSVPFDVRPSDSVVAALARIVSSKQPKVFHNAQFDVLELKRFGMPVGGEIHDTLLMHAVIAPQLSHRLTDVAAFETHAERWKTIFGDLKGDKGSKNSLFERVSLEHLLPYNAKDAQMTAILYDKLWPQVEKTHNGVALYEAYRTLEDLGMRMRERGIQVDASKFEGHRVNLGAVLDTLRAEFQTLGFPPEFELGATGQSKSLNKLFFDVFDLTPFVFSMKTGEPSLDAKTIQRFAIDINSGLPARTARLVLKFRKHAKLLSAYVDNLKGQIDLEHVAHPTWRPWGTRTGRWAASDPALQTIPKPKYNKNKEVEVPGMRDLFCAKEGLYLAEADYSQLELRIVALLANDSKLLDWYSKGEDVHTLNAQEIWQKEWSGLSDSDRKKRREFAKRVVYGLNYGGSAETIWRSLLVEFPGLPLSDIVRIVNGWFKNHPEIKTWQESQVELAKVNCYVEAPISGRRQYYHDGQIVPTEVLNFPIQATAGDITNMAILSLDKQIKWDSKYAILAQVHDAILIEGPDKNCLIELLKSSMEQTVELGGAKTTFPVDVSVGTNWGYLSRKA